MTQNPFGEGGFDMNALLQQAQQMQQQIMDAQAQLEQTEVEGTVAGGAVTVRLSGTGDLLAVEIRAGGFDSNDADDLSDLGDMIVAAWRDAKARADALASEQLGPLAGGMGGQGGELPGGGAPGGNPFGFGG
ncbi:YbaB/EbfC family nucleoid-associated protein [Nocardioides guangzhouensis]|uniref:Nucleoid-associated protein EKO23_06450 n=1 Tax=Nocardioides guangzhouensis TaxID=2497878 RepID=A0A4Q4ZI67_9ACTN|nr:YbaB/EbfC family nucleoid-associated protein [Nocardioides guangzhouensis]RYP87241.1 YbaB/EbfC family nucleoid-associated protein [Nocardioides guangzhouensis]